MKIILADTDEIYMKRLSNFFMEKAPNLDLIIFTDKSLLYDYISSNFSDIAVIDEGFIDEEFAKTDHVKLKLMLSTSQNQKFGIALIKKYQKTENLLNEIQLRYAEATDSSEMIRGSNQALGISFYSPAGGVGKSALSYGLAVAGAKAGLKVLYLNLDVNSPSYSRGLSEVFLALKTKGMNLEVKIAASLSHNEEDIYELEGVESCTELNEVTAEDIQSLIKAIKAQAVFDWLVIDMGTELSEKNIKCLVLSNHIFIPVVLNDNCIKKMLRLIKEADIHGELHDIFERTGLILNCVNSPSEKNKLESVGIGGNFEVMAEIPVLPAFKTRDNTIRSAENVCYTYKPLINKLTKG